MKQYAECFLSASASCSGGGQAPVPVFLFNPENLVPTARFYAALAAQLSAAITDGRLVSIDCATVDSRAEFFSQVFSRALAGNGNGDELTIPYDFCAFAQAFKCARLTLLLRNAAQLNPAFLDDFVELWMRGCASGRLSGRPAVSLIVDSNALLLGMDSCQRARFTLEPLPQAGVATAAAAVFDELLLQMSVQLPFWVEPSVVQRLSELFRSGVLGVPALLKRFKFLVLLRQVEQQQQKPGLDAAVNDWSGRALLLLLRKLSSQRAAASSFVAFYSALLDASLPHSEVFAQLLDDLKLMTPHAFVALFTEALSVVRAAGKLPGLGEAAATATATIATVTEACNKATAALDAHLSAAVLEPLKQAVSGSDTASSADAFKDAQFDAIAALTAEVRRLATGFAPRSVLSDERGALRKAFDADPSVALQYALKHPQLYLNCTCCGTITASASASAGSLTAESLRCALSTVNRPCLLDPCLLYRLSLEFPSRSINLVDLCESFCAVLDGKTPPSTLLR